MVELKLVNLSKTSWQVLYQPTDGYLFEAVPVEPLPSPNTPPL
jgi:hypothetical protein